MHCCGAASNVVYLLDTGEEVLVTHPEYDPDATQLEPDDSDLNQDPLESDGTYVVTLPRPRPRLTISIETIWHTMYVLYSKSCLSS